MFKLVVLFLTLSGLQAAPVAAPRDLQLGLADAFRQGTEPSRRVLVDLNTGLVQDYISEMERRAYVHSEPGDMERRARLREEVPADVPAQRNGGGWVRVEEPSTSNLPEGFRQGTEPVMSVPDGFRQGTEPIMSIPDGFRQGTEPSYHIPSGFKQGTEPSLHIPQGFRQGTEPIMSVPDGFRQGTEPVMSIPDGFRQGTEPVMSVPDGFRQGTEPVMSIPDGFRQGTEPSYHIPSGFKQGTEPSLHIPQGFRQGTEPILTIPQGFRQGTEPVLKIQQTQPSLIPQGFRQGTEPVLTLPKGFRQGTEPTLRLSGGFRQGTEPVLSLPQGFRQGTEPSTHTQTVACKGEVIDGDCYEFNPTPLSFQLAQTACRAMAPDAQLASVTNRDLHSRLVSLVTKGGETNPVLTWLGATVEKQRGSWVDGSEWTYSDWMPGHPNVHSDRPVCVEMFKMDESWWTAADCDLERASICSYPISA